MSIITFHFFSITEIADFALETLRERSPVGSANDPHPGLYRDSHTLFLNGQVVADATDWKQGDQLEISNPVPYSRKIETGKMKVSVAPDVYEGAVPIINARYGNQISCTFAFMPVKFGDVSKWSKTSTGRSLARRIRRGNPTYHSEWLVRQPTLIISAR